MNIKEIVNFAILMAILNDMVMGTVGLLSKLFLRVGVNLEVRNLPILVDLIKNRPEDIPLLSASNHTSTIDDPLMFGILPTDILINSSRMRWTLGAEEIIFTNPFYRTFFSTGRVLPIRRGDGIGQPSIDKMIELLNRGEWIHMFPEGRIVNDSNRLKIRLKWGIARMLLESRNPPIFLPIVHQGFENILPVGGRIPNLNKKLIINIGNPISTTNLRSHLSETMDISLRRSLATKFVADELSKLYQPDWNKS